MNARFEPTKALRGQVTPPPDKSISHRAAIFGAMNDEPVAVRNYLDAADTRSTLGALRSLGAGVEERGGDVLIRGTGLRAALEPTMNRLDVGNSGTLMRLLPGWLAGQAGAVFTLDGDESIRRRPVDRIAEPLRRMGAHVEARDGRLPPLTVHGTELSGADHTLEVASAQVKSCLLIAGVLATGHTSVTEPAQSRDHTERILCRSRVPFERAGTTCTVSQVDELELDELRVPGDPSSAAFLAAAASVVEGSRIVIRDVALNWTRTGFFRIAERMGAVVVGELEAEPEAVPEEEPAGEIDVAQSPLEGTVIEPEEVPLAIDELPLVALLGCFAEGETVVRGAQELRLKESDRIAGVVEGLRALGADIEAAPDGFVVRGDGGLAGGRMDARGDHRLAMLGAVAGLASREGVEVAGMEVAEVSYPGFEADLETLAS
jgi:3-phosphoshikimate 1-carboxyvinyltransferase